MVHPRPQPPDLSQNAFAGLFPLTVLMIVFLSFLLINVFSPDVLSRTDLPVRNSDLSFNGPNFAVVAGLLLIVASVLLSLLFVRHARPKKT